MPPSSQLPKLWAQTELLPSAILPSEPVGIGIGRGGGHVKFYSYERERGGGGRTEHVLAMLKGEEQFLVRFVLGL